MKIIANGTLASATGPAEWFTGRVRVDQSFTTEAPARLRTALVTFEPGARTAWHTHPLGQLLAVTAGCGRAQSAGGPVRVLKPGDIVWFSPGERHWHGAAPQTALTHLAMQEAENGVVVTWEEHVNEADYLAAPE